MTAVRRALVPLCVLAAVLSAGCPPTLSRERGPAYLAAMARADRAHSHGDMHAAATAFADAARHAQRRVDRDEAEFREAHALERVGDDPHALALFDAIAARRPVSRRTVRALYDASLLRAHRGDQAGALAGYRRIVREHPGSGLAARALFWVVPSFPSASAARAYLASLYAHVGTSDLGDDILMHEADLALSVHDRAGARAALVRIVREHPYPQGGLWDDALWRLADMEVEDGRPRRAIAWLERMVSVRETTWGTGSYTRPRFAPAQLRIARLYRDALHDFDHAAAAFRATYDDYPTSLLRDDALVELGEMELDAGKQQKGCATLRRALAEFSVGSARRRAHTRVIRDCPRPPN